MATVVALQLLLQEYSSLLEIANDFEYETTELQERHVQAQSLLVPDRRTHRNPGQSLGETGFFCSSLTLTVCGCAGSASLGI